MPVVDLYVDELKKELAANNNPNIINKNEELLSQHAEELTKSESFFSLPLNIILSIVSKIDFSLIDNSCECIVEIIKNYIKNNQDNQKDAIQFLNFINVDSIEIGIQECISIFNLFPFSSICSKLTQIYSNQQKDLDFDFQYENDKLKQQIDDLKGKILQHYNKETVFRPVTNKSCYHSKNIFHAVWESNLIDLQYYIEQLGHSPDEIYEEKSLLMYAACSGNIPIIRYLVEKAGANLKLTESGYEARMAIHFAASSGQIPALQYFIHEAHVDVETREKELRTPLLWACVSGSVSTVKYLIEEEKANINAIDQYGSNCLHFACSNQNNMELIHYLVDELKFDVNTVNNNDLTPLHFSILHGDIEAVKYFIEEKGVNLYHINFQGNTYLHVAANFGRYNIIQYLLSKGLDKTTKNKESQTPYKTVCIYAWSDFSHKAEILELLF